MGGKMLQPGVKFAIFFQHGISEAPLTICIRKTTPANEHVLNSFHPGFKHATVMLIWHHKDIYYKSQPWVL